MINLKMIQISLFLSSPPDLMSSPQIFVHQISCQGKPVMPCCRCTILIKGHFQTPGRWMKHVFLQVQVLIDLWFDLSDFVIVFLLGWICFCSACKGFLLFFLQVVRLDFLGSQWQWLCNLYIYIYPLNVTGPEILHWPLKARTGWTADVARAGNSRWFGPSLKCRCFDIF